jgi:hypothetical protein
MDPTQIVMQALIDETEALGWDFPEQLEVAAENPPVHEGFAIVGKLLTLKKRKKSFRLQLQAEVVDKGKALWKHCLLEHFMNENSKRSVMLYVYIHTNTSITHSK